MEDAGLAKGSNADYLSTSNGAKPITLGAIGPSQSQRLKNISLEEENAIIKHPDHVPLRAFGVFLTGIVFGLALNKAGVYRAEAIRAQMRFEDNTMLITFLMAAATSMFTLATMHYAKFHSHLDAAGHEYHTRVEGTPAVALGAFLLGSGMSISGACPGTLYAQLGAGSLHTFWTMGGAVIGAMVYGVSEKHLRRFKAWLIPPKVTVYELLNTNRLKTAAVMVPMFIGAAVGAYYLPGQTKVGVDGRPIMQPYTSLGTAVTDLYWSPFLAGPIIGMLQLPLSLLLEKNLGCSSTFQMVAANLLRPLRSRLPFSYMEHFLSGFKVWWQLVLVAGVVLGSLLAITTSEVALPPGESKFYSIDGVVSPLESVLGGAVLVFGGRMANGCTSGHGISGVGHQGLNSLVAVAAMFGGGIFVANVVY